MKKPTLEQLKKRPAVWYEMEYGELRISHPNNFCEVVLTIDDPRHSESLFEVYFPVALLYRDRDLFEFVGWL